MSLALTQLYADYAHRVCGHLCAEPQASYRATFDNVLVESIDLYPFTSFLDIDGTTARKITDAVLDLLVPLASGKRHSLPVLRWALDRYLTDTHNGQQILAEDLSKIGDDITYFERLKKSPAFTGNPDLLSYASLAALQAALAPHAASRARKAGAGNNRHMPPEVKNRIMSETTVLYQGPEGRVVVPHTVGSSRYWGQATKWCVSGEDAHKHFPTYNRKSPVIMLLPRGGDKTALVGRTLYNSADVALSAWPQAAQTLWQKALAARAPETAAWLEQTYAPDLKALPVSNNPAASLPPHLRARFEKFKAEREADILNPRAYDAEFANRDFVLAVLELDGMYLEYAAPDLKKDRDVVLGAVTQNGLALMWAADEWKADRLMVLTALKTSSAAFHSIQPDVRNNRAFKLDALKVNGLVLRCLYISEQADYDYALAAVTSNGLALDVVYGENAHKLDILLAATQNTPWAYDARRIRHEPTAQTSTLVAANPLVGLVIPEQMRTMTSMMTWCERSAFFLDALRTMCEQGRADEARPYLRFNAMLWDDPDKLFAPPADVLPVLEAAANPRMAWKGPRPPAA